MSQIISLITALILLAVAIITARGDIPWWVVLIVVLVFVGWVIGTNYRRVSFAVKDLLQKRREQKFTKRHWGELRKRAIRLQETTDSGRKEIASEIYELAKKAVPDKQNYYNPQGLKHTVNNTLGKFITLLDVQRRNRSTFEASVELLDSLYRLWHNRLVMEHARDIMKDLETVKYIANRDELQNYNTCRHWHTDLMDEYTQFAKVVNANIDNRVVRLTECEPVPDLWRG